jgi:endonuclease/exonuclease/phosphatase family metal-dependent hydrolase
MKYLLQLSLLLCLTACQCVGPSNHPPTTLKVLTYNIHHGEGVDASLDLPRIAEIITRAQPDLVALQEVDNRTQRTGGVDQAAELARLTGMNHVFGPAMPYQGGEYGQAILSRFPIAEHQVHVLPQQPGREPRVALAVRIQNPGLWFVGTHLDHQLDAVRIPQAQELQRLFGERTEPVILAGDFNARPTNQTMRVFHDWTDAASRDPQPTIPAEHPRHRIDYILLRPAGAWQIVETKVLEEPVASDHRPVSAILKLN